MLSPTKRLSIFARTAILASPRSRAQVTPTKASAPSTPKSSRRTPSTPTTPASPAAGAGGGAKSSSKQHAVLEDSPSALRRVRTRLSLSFDTAGSNPAGGGANAAPSDASSETAFSPSSLAAAAESAFRAAISDGEWRYALDQLRRLVPHSERLAPWQQHAALLLACSRASLRLGEAGQAARFALDAVELHSAVSCEAAAVHARVVAAQALDKAGRRAEAATHFAAAIATVESKAHAPDQTAANGRTTAPVDPALPFLEYARLLEATGSHEARLDLLHKAVRVERASPSSVAAAHGMLAGALAADRQSHAIADGHYEQAIAAAPRGTDQHADLLAEAAFFAQHKLHNVDRAVQRYTQLFDIRPPTILEPSVQPAMRCSRTAERLLNAGTCFDQHPLKGCAASVPLFRAALSHFHPDASNSYRLRLYLARAYAGSGQVDRALEEYEAVIRQLSAGREDAIQVDVAGVRGYLPLCEVYGHLGLCLFQRVGDAKGAQLQLEKAFEVAKTLTITPQPVSAAPADPTITTIRAKRRPPPPDRTLEWLHEAMGALCLRTGDLATALTHLEEKIEYAHHRNDPAFDAHLHLAAVYEFNGRAEDARDVYRHLFDLPLSASTREQRLDVTLRYAWLCHYTLADYEAAVTLYLAALHVDADNPHAMVQAAWCMLQLPEISIAEVEALYISAALAVEMAKQAGPVSQWDECYVLGECAVFHHDYTKNMRLAQELYSTALTHKNSENFAQVAANFAVFLHHEHKDTERAQAWFEAAMQSNAQLPAAATLYADFLTQTNQLEAAVGVLTKMLETNRSEAWHKLGRIAERMVTGDSYDAAAATYLRALGAPDELTDATDDMVKVYVGLLQPAQLPIAIDLLLLLQYKARRDRLVEAIYPELLARFPHEAQLYMHHAKFCTDVLKRKRRAHDAFRRAVALEPANVTVLDHYAEFLAGAFPDRLDAAEAVHLQSVRLNPASPQAHFSFASFLTYVYRAPERAEEHFKTALSLDPRDSVTLCCYATFLENQAEARGRAWEFHDLSLQYAERMYTEAAEIAPTNASHAVFFANFLWRQRRHGEAWHHIKRALDHEPGNPATLRLCGIFLHDVHIITHGASSTGPGGNTAPGTSGTTTASASNLLVGSSAAGVAVGAGTDGHLSTDTLPLILCGRSEDDDGIETLVEESFVSFADAADRAFRKALILGGQKDPVTLRAYSKFIDDVKRDPQTASAVEAAAVEIELADHDAAIVAATDELSEIEAAAVAAHTSRDGRRGARGGRRPSAASAAADHDSDDDDDDSGSSDGSGGVGSL